MTPLLQHAQKSPLKLRLAKDLVRSIKRGHPWVFAEALRRLPKALPGAPAILLDNKKGREIAQGFYDPSSPLAFRACTLTAGKRPDEDWALRRFERALHLRRMLFDENTTGFRLFNGEGDGLPGLICDVYNHTAVIQLDGAGPSGFWQPEGVAAWVADALAVGCVYFRRRDKRGQALIGQTPTQPIPFQENGVRFTADVVRGQKTGFFLDQRDNRHRIKAIVAGRRVLNVFGYTGGFSIYAGLGGARQVTTVDLAGPALSTAQTHWRLNHLPAATHDIVEADAFHFLKTAAKKKRTWEVVIVDPPSFAASKAAVPKARQAYQTLIAAGAQVTEAEGLLAAASCSSHITPEAFMKICEAGISLAKRRATVLGIHGQPADHPTPLAFPEFRYLKFVLMRVE